jgi:UDP-N-acetylglucosamine 1-carboxyvinyltransferase
MGIKLHIDGGNKLNGALRVENSKNALLPIIASVILTRGTTVLKSVPKLSDIDNLLKILISLGIRAKWSGGDLILDTTEIVYNEIDAEVAAKIRGSIFVLGAILGRFKMASVPYPGGCAIGNRPIDLHLQILRDLGVKVTEKNNTIVCKNMPKSHSKHTFYPRNRYKNGTFLHEIFLDFASVGASENIIMASVLGNTRVKITGIALEPEVEDLCNFLNSCGARICGIGTNTVTIYPVAELNGTTYTPIPDRINTGSYLIAAAACGGNVKLTNVRPNHNANLIAKLKKAGCEIETTLDTISISSPGNLRAVGTVHTAPYPGFPTDLQSQFSTLSATMRGATTVTENLFENRYKYCPELQKIGAKMCPREKVLSITGVKKLHLSQSQTAPTNLFASDLRGGVALVIAAISSPGYSIIHNAEYIYRGHANIENDLSKLGANILRADD